MTKQTKRKGLSLVELLVAVAVFSIVMLAVSGLIVQGLQVRRQNEVEVRAQSYAVAVLERFKSFWGEAANYKDFDKDDLSTWPGLPDDTDIQAIFSAGTLSLETSCLDLSGTELTDADCQPPALPPLRRIQVTLEDDEGKRYANLITEVGNPSP